jgi:hypothetical protein
MHHTIHKYKVLWTDKCYCIYFKWQASTYSPRFASSVLSHANKAVINGKTIIPCICVHSVQVLISR